MDLPYNLNFKSESLQPVDSKVENLKLLIDERQQWLFKLSYLADVLLRPPSFGGISGYCEVNSNLTLSSDNQGLDRILSKKYDLGELDSLPIYAQDEISKLKHINLKLKEKLKQVDRKNEELHLIIESYENFIYSFMVPAISNGMKENFESSIAQLKVLLLQKNFDLSLDLWNNYVKYFKSIMILKLLCSEICKLLDKIFLGDCRLVEQKIEIAGYLANRAQRLNFGIERLVPESFD